jgi:hypothetical protein
MIIPFRKDWKHNGAADCEQRLDDRLCRSEMPFIASSQAALLPRNDIAETGVYGKDKNFFS